MFLETIKYQDGHWYNLAFHQQRLDQCRTQKLQRQDVLLLSEALATAELPDQGVYKVRVQYAEAIEQISWAPYQIKYPASLQLVYDDSIDYAFKYQDRTALDNLFAQRGTCDDILIVRNGLLTDTYYANVALYDGQQWLTPAQPLLAGTQRARLLAQEQLRLADIRVKDLSKYQKLILLNAFMNFETAVEVQVADIRI